MTEKLEREQGLLPENLEDQKYKEFQAAMDEEDRIMKDINTILASVSDRKEAEKVVLEKWAPLMDEAMKKSHEALKAWLGTMREASEQD